MQEYNRPVMDFEFNGGELSEITEEDLKAHKEQPIAQFTAQFFIL